MIQENYYKNIKNLHKSIVLSIESSIIMVGTFIAGKFEKGELNEIKQIEREAC